MEVNSPERDRLAERENGAEISEISGEVEAVKIEGSTVLFGGSKENKLSSEMEAAAFEGPPYVTPATFDPTTDPLRLLEENRLLPKAKGTVKTIEDLESGDVIDCVDFWQQPAFDDPKIKEGHQKEYGDWRISSKLKMKMPGNISPCGQSWHKFGECPEGTVPIRRSRGNSCDLKKCGPPRPPC